VIFAGALAGLFLLMAPTQAYVIGTNASEPVSAPSPTSTDRKITAVFKEYKRGNQTFAAFGLSKPGGQGRSTDLIIIQDMTNSNSQDLFRLLSDVHAHGQYIRQFTNTSPNSESGQWFGFNTFYRVYAGDNCYFFSE
jgi:hypothetical protein